MSYCERLISSLSDSCVCQAGHEAESTEKIRVRDRMETENIPMCNDIGTWVVVRRLLSSRSLSLIRWKIPKFDGKFGVENMQFLTNLFQNALVRGTWEAVTF